MVKSRRRKNTIAKVALRNRAKLKQLSSMIEYKWLDGSYTGQDVNDTMSTGAMLLNVIAVGDGHNKREGREIHARRIFIRGAISNNNGTPEDAVVRLLLVRYKAPKGNALSPATVLLNHTTTVGSVYSNLSMALKEDLDILVDETFSMDTSQHTIIPFKIKKKLNHTVNFNDDVAGSTFANLYANALYLVAISDVSGTTNCPTIDFEWRYSYCDL